MPRLNRTLAEITADAMHANCGAGDCWATPGEPCSCAPGMHLARYARACRKGVISDGEMRAVFEAAHWLVTPGTVIPAGALAVAS
jgi:hypothetical protein